ncbi:MAG: hypothetical protein LBT46_04875, partial [Planctomycetaceae bacterium]|nr:hypothetical protein [Planctomycetaceae bacterium]
YCVDCGFDFDQMATLFQTAADRLRKEAGIPKMLGDLGQAAGGAAALAIPVSALASAGLGYGVGRTLGNTAVGDLPSTEDIQATDEVATLERERDAIIQRILTNRRKKTESSKPSVRRLFN